MPLPKIQSVIHDLTIPGTTQVVKYRPFLMKEYKALLQSREFGDDMGFVNVIRAIITDCTFNKLDIDNLPLYVIDYIYLMIHAKSTGEMVTSQYHCINPITREGGEIKPCNAKFDVQFSLMDAFVKFPPEYNQKCIIQINDDLGLRLKSPSFSKFRSIGLAGKELFELADDYIFSCVDCIFDGDKVLTPGTDFNLAELTEFIEQIPASKMNEITKFFETQPKVTLELNITCPKCKNKSTVELSGAKDFFD
jgi:hypothetical protein